MKKQYAALIIFPLIFLAVAFSAFAQNDNCSSAIQLCANNLLGSSTAGGTSNTGGITDPALSCGDGVIQNSVWFTVEGICTGSSTITVSGIDNNPGLEMEIYTGSCGSLITTGLCASANGPSGSMSLTINPTVSGQIYYVMVDGASGNQELFDINATGCLKGRPIPGFIANPYVGCVPLCVSLDNITTENGGPVTYSWKVVNGTNPPLTVSSSGADTTWCLDSIGNYTITLTAGNSCGTTTSSQKVDVQDLFPSISYLPANPCIGTPVNFTGSAPILPNPPATVANVIQWQWDFGDTASGANNTYVSGSALDSTATHIFVGAGPCFNVRLVAQGTCGFDTAYVNVCVLPSPLVDAGNDTIICEGLFARLHSTVSSATLPVSYQWTGTGGTILCDTCPKTNVIGLTVAGSPYTFILNITDDNGCIASDTVNVQVNVIPVASAGPDDTTCAWTPAGFCGSVIVVGTPPVTYQWSPSAGLNDSTLLCPTANIGATTNYILRITDSIGCISLPDTMTMFVYPKPTIIPQAVNLCASDPDLSDTLTITGAGPGSTYSWCPSSDTNCVLITSAVAADSSSIIVTLPPAPGNYCFTAIVTDGVTGCIDTINNCLQVIPPITVSISPNPVIICHDSCIVLTATGPAGVTWLWSPGGETTDTIMVCPASTTTYKVTGTFGCTSSDSVTVNVNPQLVVDAGPDDTVCAWTPTPLCATIVTGGTPPHKYLWTPSAGLSDSTAACPIATVGSTTTYCVTITDSIGCLSASDCVTLNVYPKPSMSFTPDTTCVSNLPPLNDTLTINGAGAGSTYNWCPYSGANCSLISSALTADSSSVVVSLPSVTGSYCFTALVTDGITGCVDTVTGCVVMNSGIAVAITPSSANICQGDSTTLTASGPAGATYLWNTGDTAAAITVTPASTSTYWVTATEGSCTDRDTVTVTITNKPSADAGANPFPLCQNNPVSLKGTAINGSVTWISTGGGSFSPASNDTTTYTPAASDTGLFVLTMIVSNGVCPDDSDSVMVYFAPAAIASAGAAQPVCAGDTAVVTGASVSPANGIILWSTNGDGAFIPGNTVLNPSYIPGPNDTVNGSVQLCLKVSNAPCPDSTSCITVIINKKPTITLNATKDTICLGDISTITATGGGLYLWNTIPPKSSSSIQVSPANDSTYVVVVTNSSGCISADSIRIFVVQPPDAGLNDTVCEGDSIMLNGAVSPANANGGYWTCNGSGVFLQDSLQLNAVYVPGPSDTAVTTITFVLTTISSACPSYNDTVDVTIRETTVDAGPDQEVKVDDIIVLSPKVVNAGCVEWSSSGTGSFSPGPNTVNASYTPSTLDYDQDSIVLSITSCNGCIPDTDSMVITFIDIKAPNVITPGTTPGFNDAFWVKGLPDNSHLEIYDRWGLRVYKSDNYRNDFKADNLPPGVYYYILLLPKNLKLAKYEYTGFLEVIK